MRAARQRSRRDGDLAGGTAGGRRQTSAGALASCPGGSGIEAVTTERMLTGDRSVFEIALQPGLGAQGKRSGRRIVGLVAKDDTFAADLEQLGIAQGAAAQIACEIKKNPFAVVVSTGEPDVPFDTPEAVD